MFKRKTKKELKVEIEAVLKRLMDGEIIGIQTPAFQFYFEKFISGTTSMRATEAGAYLFLLIRQWDKWGLPNDPNDLAETGRCDVDIISKIIKKFVLCSDGRYRNRRLEEVRAEQIVFREQQSKGGIDGNLKRWGKKEEKQVPVITTETGPKVTTKRFSLDYLDNTPKLEALARSHKVSIERIRELLVIFKSKRENDEREYLTISDLRSHFDNFCGKNIETPSSKKKKEREQCPYSDEQLRQADAQKASGFGTPEWFDKKWLHLLKN